MGDVLTTTGCDAGTPASAGLQIIWQDVAWYVVVDHPRHDRRYLAGGVAALGADWPADEANLMPLEYLWGGTWCILDCVVDLIPLLATQTVREWHAGLGQGDRDLICIDLAAPARGAGAGQCVLDPDDRMVRLLVDGNSESWACSGGDTVTLSGVQPPRQADEMTAEEVAMLFSAAVDAGVVRVRNAIHGLPGSSPLGEVLL